MTAESGMKDHKKEWSIKKRYGIRETESWSGGTRPGITRVPGSVSKSPSFPSVFCVVLFKFNGHALIHPSIYHRSHFTMVV